jgi:hypothetical protein
MVLKSFSNTIEGSLSPVMETFMYALICYQDSMRLRTMTHALRAMF